jgi:hypothetical protein
MQSSIRAALIAAFFLSTAGAAGAMQPQAAQSSAQGAPAGSGNPVPAGPPLRVSIGSIDKAPVGQEIEVVGYYSHKSDEVDGDLQVWLIDHKGSFVVAEAPKRFRAMRYFIRGLHLHRGELVDARGVLTRQQDKPTTNYRNGWMEINPVDYISRYEGPKPDDLKYTRVAHHLFGPATVTQE